MGAKWMLWGEHGRTRFLDGADALAELAAITFGPSGRHVIVDRGSGLSPLVTRSGRDVARAVELADPFANMGVRALRGASQVLFAEAGDGTTTAVLLARRMIRGALAALHTGIAADRLRHEMIDATIAAIADLASHARPCDHREIAFGVARAAAGGDDEIADGVVAALAGGDPAQIQIEPGSGVSDQIEHARGHGFGFGASSTEFPLHGATAGPRNVRFPALATELVLERPLVMICHAALTTVEHVAPALELALAAHRPLLVVASSITGDALRTLVVNHAAGRIRCAGIAPQLAEDDGYAVLADLAVLTGAALLPEPALLRTAAELGSARAAVVGAEQTTLDDPGGDRDAIAAHIRSIQGGAPDAASSSPSAHAHHRELVARRLRALRGAGSVLRVGGRSDAELRLRIAAFEAARSAVAGAVDEGVVIGGGVALVHAREAVRATDRSVGARVVAACLGEPLRVLLGRGGPPGVEDAIVADRSRRAGFDVRSGRLGDLDVFDPVRVARLALQTATGVATTVMDSALMMVRPVTGGERALDPGDAARTREASWGADRPAAGDRLGEAAR